GEGGLVLVGAGRDDRREAPRIALHRHVVRRGDEHRAAEVRAVGELVEEAGELFLRRREAHVDDVEALADRPAQALEQDGAAALEPGAKHADAEEPAVRCERADDSGAGRAVAAEIAPRLVLDDDLAPAGLPKGDRAFDLAGKPRIRRAAAV